MFTSLEEFFLELFLRLCLSWQFVSLSFRTRRFFEHRYSTR